eukprot:3776868-Rhodomonas_salina.2
MDKGEDRYELESSQIAPKCSCFGFARRTPVATESSNTEPSPQEVASALRRLSELHRSGYFDC